MILNKAEGVQYELFDISELDEMAAMTAETFVRYEPVTSSLGIPSEDFADFVWLLGPKVEQEELTVIARNQETNQIIGAMVTNDFAIEPPEEMRHLGDNFEPSGQFWMNWTTNTSREGFYQKANIFTFSYLQ